MTPIALLMLAAAAWSTSAQAATCTTTLTPADDLQAAVDAAADYDVICLGPGVYSPFFQVDLHRPVTLQGPQVGVDPRPTAGSRRVAGDELTEAILDGELYGLGTLLLVTADDVVVDGIEIRNGTGDLVQSPNGTPLSGVVIRNAIIHDASGDEEIQLRTVADAVVENNHVFRTAGDAINICCGSSGATIRHNEVHQIDSDNAAIYTYGNGAGGSSFVIDGNLVYEAWGDDGIKVGIKSGTDADQPGGLVVNNQVFDVSQDGITVYTSDTEVVGNEVWSTYSAHGAIYVGFDVDGVQITDNLVHGNGTDGGAVTWAVMVGGASLYPTDTVVSGNCFDDNEAGVGFDDSGVPLLAEDNWWGAPSGPSGAGPGAGQAVAVGVDYDPWLASHDLCAPDTDGDGDPDQLDCAPADAAIHHAAIESCDGIDNDCDGAIDEGAPTGSSTWYADFDDDGYGDAGVTALACAAPFRYLGDSDDCDDSSPDINPAAPEVPYDGVDNDCYLGDECDVDSDGYDATVATCAGTDCDDDDADIFPGGIETPYDGVDDDCDGADLCDADHDGYDAGIATCPGLDCDDDDAQINPGQLEVPWDGIDQDCDGADECDVDGDGFASDDVHCGGTDCDDEDEDVFPGATEVPYDGIDNDCLAGDLCDVDGDGVDSAVSACDGRDCDDGDADVHPGAIDTCGDGVDQDCDEVIDDADLDGDGYVDASCGGLDCDDSSDTVHPGAEEQCNEVDDDCNGSVDDLDADEDGHLAFDCGGNDCDDRDHHINPDATEDCSDGLDNDCDGYWDDMDDDCAPPSGGCGCGGGPQPISLVPLVLAALALRRRERTTVSNRPISAR